MASGNTSILLLEDDLKLSNEIQLFLNNQNFDCEIVLNGQDCLEKLKLKSYDLLILDINVPIINGIDVCKNTRTMGIKTPVMMLTAFSDIDNKVNALESGADDYLAKPFHFEELHARIKALLRRAKQNVEEFEKIIIADLEIIPETMQVFRSEKQIMLTPKEYKLLLALAKAKGKTLSKQVIAEEVWNINFETGTNTIEVYINFLRNKIDKDFTEKLIHTRPGFGYYLKNDI
ncbi:MAG: response regulator transcription factor [Bacteroidia bacterium]